jgi:hypothetical protein
VLSCGNPLGFGVTTPYPSNGAGCHTSSLFNLRIWD